MKYKLFPYQEDLVKQARQSIANGSKGVLIQSPPGSGKSVIIAEIAKSATDKGNHVLFIVHRKELIEQIRRTFIRQDVDKNYTTIMTVGKVANRLDKLPYPTIIITDETHHSRAKTYRKIYDHYSKAIRLGFTATPWRMSGKGFTDIYDEMLKGKSVQWLIDNEFLAPFEYHSATLADLEQLKTASTGDYTKASMDDAVDSKIFGDVVKHYKKLATGRKTILYAHSVETSRELAETFKTNGINAVHADAKTPPKEREQIMGDFRTGKIQVLCNVDLISEGFDVPDCSCVIMVRPTASLVLHMQQSMRAMRYQPNKKAILIDHVANYSRHGLPTSEHEWTIADREKKTVASPSDPEFSIRRCAECGEVNFSKSWETIQIGHRKGRICPSCQAMEDVLSTEISVDETIELQRISQEEAELTRLKNKHWKKATSYSELLRMAKAKGYKPSWASFKAYDLGLDETPAWVIRVKNKEKDKEQDKEQGLQLNFGKRFY